RPAAGGRAHADVVVADRARAGVHSVERAQGRGSDPARRLRDPRRREERRPRLWPRLRRRPALGGRAGQPAAAGGARAGGADPRRQKRPPRREYARRVTRPDPAAGVFETVLVENGVALYLDAHLERLTASVSALYGAHLDPATFERAWAAAEGAAER